MFNEDFNDLGDECDKVEQKKYLQVEDSFDECFVSPPTLVKYEEETPRYYFLRGNSKWSSSTPLPSLIPLSVSGTSSSSPTLTTTSSPIDTNITSTNKLELVNNFEQRLLDNLDHDDTDCNSYSEQETDSGFESINSTDTPESSCSEETTCCPISPPTTLHLLGAIPKRRSPRTLKSRHRLDGIERLDRLKVLPSNHSFSLPNTEKFLYKKNQLLLHGSKEGREFCDIVRFLYERNLSHVLGNIFKYLAGRDLCMFTQASQMWNLSLRSCKKVEEDRLSYVTIQRLDRENFGKKVVLRSSCVVISPRRVMGEMNYCCNSVSSYTVSPGGTKRDSTSRSSSLVSPSKIRHRLFVTEAAKLSPGERLVHCPLCTKPSRVNIHIEGEERAECSSVKCGFIFCPLCQCAQHEGRGCRVTRTTSSKLPKNGAVTSKKSKARLRRL